MWAHSDIPCPHLRLERIAHVCLGLEARRGGDDEGEEERKVQGRAASRRNARNRNATARRAVPRRAAQRRGRAAPRRRVQRGTVMIKRLINFRLAA